MGNFRYWISVLIIAAAAFAGGLLSGEIMPVQTARAQTVRIVDAEMFRLLDAGGKERARLSLEGDRAVLALKDSGETERVRLYAGDTGAVMLMYDEKGNLVLNARAGAGDNTPQGISVIDGNSKQRLFMGMMSSSTSGDSAFPMISLYDEDMTKAMRLYDLPGGDPSIDIIGEKGITTWSAPPNEELEIIKKKND